jgi:hypothetical protein
MRHLALSNLRITTLRWTWTLHGGRAQPRDGIDYIRPAWSALGDLPMCAATNSELCGLGKVLSGVQVMFSG